MGLTALGMLGARRLTGLGLLQINTQAGDDSIDASALDAGGSMNTSQFLRSLVSS
jgi:hypothetical protein